MPKGRAPGEPPQKIEQLRAFMSAGDWRSAIKLAASFPQLGEEKAAISRAWEAIARPEFQRAIGKDPDALISAGVESLRRRYGCEPYVRAVGNHGPSPDLTVDIAAEPSR